MEAYTESWKFGLKAVAIYRDNSKGSQPLSVSGKKKEEKAATPVASPVAAIEAPLAKVEVPSHEQQELFDRTKRRKLPNERSSITHKFSIGGHGGYPTGGKHGDGTPRESFIQM